MRENAVDVVCELLSRFMAVESSFAAAGSKDEAIAALTKANSADLAAVYKIAFAHEQLGLRGEKKGWLSFPGWGSTPARA